METKDYLRILCEEIHSTVVATVDEEGHPVTRVIDMMLYDDTSIYFLTAKGKGFYKQLMEQKYISISGMTGGKDSMSKKAISIKGKVENIGKSKLDEIFQKNTYMAEIYPVPETRVALEVFRVREGEGDFFDLSTKPITRGTFVVGDKKESVQHGGYFITDRCRGCRICYSKCPQKCIELTQKPLVIKQENCLHCGNCFSVCPFGAIEKRA
jgi:uncharacterized pyridoxamine 5'-phosphate oxidase family protein/NAD-dependent dihydropyrimidine dehydrogenase PreA subunit